jgi:hypothetical protein
MDSHRETDRLLSDAKHLQNLLSQCELEGDRLELALSVAKRVRRTSTVLVKRLARERDDEIRHSQEADTE